MASGNTVTLTFAGDSSSLEKAFSNVGSSAVKMSGDFDKAESKSKSFGGAMDSVGSSVGDAESKFMGTADLLDGLGGAFGLPTEGATGLMRAFGDLSGGFEVVQGMFSSGVGKIGEFASAIVSSSAVTKAWTGLQLAFNAVMAANPVFLIGAAVVALGAALVLAYQKSETFRDIVQGAFRVVREAAVAVWDFLSALPQKIMAIAGAIKDALLWPYKTAFNLIAKAWNSTVGKLSFEIPSWVPGLGGKGFKMPQLPEFHTGGMVGQGLTPGTEVPILALAGEQVSPIAGGGGGGTTVIQLVIDRNVITEVVHQGLLAKQRRTPLGLAT